VYDRGFVDLLVYRNSLVNGGGLDGLSLNDWLDCTKSARP
jgi:hypothetical protein